MNGTPVSRMLKQTSSCVLTPSHPATYIKRYASGTQSFGPCHPSPCVARAGQIIHIYSLFSLVQGMTP